MKLLRQRSVKLLDLKYSLLHLTSPLHGALGDLSVSTPHLYLCTLNTAFKTAWIFQSQLIHCSLVWMSQGFTRQVMNYTWLGLFFFLLFFFVFQVRQSDSQPTGRADSISKGSCFAVASHERVLCSCSQLSWEIITWVFLNFFYLWSPIFWSVDVDAATKGWEQREQKEKWLVAYWWAVHPPLTLSCFFIFCPVSLFHRMPGMPPIFLCSNYCLCKLCQRAEIVLIRGPAAFASVIWWVSLGTRKTRLSRGYMATSEPQGRLRLFLAPSC